MLTHRTIRWFTAILLVGGVGLATGLLILFGNGEHPAQLDAIKTAGTFVVGVGGGAALWLAARRQRAGEVALNQKHTDQQAVERAFVFQQERAEQDRKQLEQAAAATVKDAEQRRITDLYTKAVELLGSDKASVRLGGMYALRRLAQDNFSQRQTVVDVLCAYLRMPYVVPGDHPEGQSDSDTLRLHQQRIEERQVRLTAQRLLATHLSPGPNDEPAETFWSKIDLDLTGAVLIDFTLSHCQLRAVSFDGARFVGTAAFEWTRFNGTASFVRAAFGEKAGFLRVSFDEKALFSGATFRKDADFNHARFDASVDFHHAEFCASADFTQTAFHSGPLTEVTFSRAHFHHEARFELSAFDGDTSFGAAVFDGEANFSGTHFGSIAHFSQSAFAEGLGFNNRARADGVVHPLSPAWVRLDVHSKVISRRSWPPGWSVVTTEGRPTNDETSIWGHLIRTT